MNKTAEFGGSVVLEVKYQPIKKKASLAPKKSKSPLKINRAVLSMDQMSEGVKQDADNSRQYDLLMQKQKIKTGKVTLTNKEVNGLELQIKHQLSGVSMPVTKINLGGKKRKRARFMGEDVDTPVGQSYQDIMLHTFCSQGMQAGTPHVEVEPEQTVQIEAAKETDEPASPVAVMELPVRAASPLPSPEPLKERQKPQAVIQGEDPNETFNTLRLSQKSVPSQLLTKEETIDVQVTTQSAYYNQKMVNLNLKNTSPKRRHGDKLSNCDQKVNALVSKIKQIKTFENAPAWVQKIDSEPYANPQKQLPAFQGKQVQLTQLKQDKRRQKAETAVNDSQSNNQQKLHSGRPSASDILYQHLNSFTGYENLEKLPRNNMNVSPNTAQRITQINQLLLSQVTDKSNDKYYSRSGAKHKNNSFLPHIQSQERISLNEDLKMPLFSERVHYEPNLVERFQDKYLNSSVVLQRAESFESLGSFKSENKTPMKLRNIIRSVNNANQNVDRVLSTNPSSKKLKSAIKRENENFESLQGVVQRENSLQQLLKAHHLEAQRRLKAQKEFQRKFKPYFWNSVGSSDDETEIRRKCPKHKVKFEDELLTGVFSQVDLQSHHVTTGSGEDDSPNVSPRGKYDQPTSLIKTADEQDLASGRKKNVRIKGSKGKIIPARFKNLFDVYSQMHHQSNVKGSHSIETSYKLEYDDASGQKPSVGSTKYIFQSEQARLQQVISTRKIDAGLKQKVATMNKRKKSEYEFPPMYSDPVDYQNRKRHRALQYEKYYSPGRAAQVKEELNNPPPTESMLRYKQNLKKRKSNNIKANQYAENQKGGDPTADLLTNMIEAEISLNAPLEEQELVIDDKENKEKSRNKKKKKQVGSINSIGFRKSPYDGSTGGTDEKRVKGNIVGAMAQPKVHQDKKGIQLMGGIYTGSVPQNVFSASMEPTDIEPVHPLPKPKANKQMLSRNNEGAEDLLFNDSENPMENSMYQFKPWD